MAPLRQRLTDFLEQVAREILQPLQLLQRGAHQRLSLLIITLQTNLRLNQARRHLRVTLVKLGQHLHQELIAAAIFSMERRRVAAGESAD